MHTNWCVLIEISMEIGMLNSWLGLLVTALTKETYFSINLNLGITPIMALKTKCATVWVCAHSSKKPVKNSKVKLLLLNAVCNIRIAIVISNISNHICFCYSWWRTIQNNVSLLLWTIHKRRRQIFQNGSNIKIND